MSQNLQRYDNTAPITERFPFPPAGIIGRAEPAEEKQRDYSNREHKAYSQLYLFGLTVIAGLLTGILIWRWTGKDEPAILGGLAMFLVFAIPIAILGVGEWAPTIEAFFRDRTARYGINADRDVRQDYIAFCENESERQYQAKLAEIALQEKQIRGNTTEQWMIESIQQMRQQLALPSTPPASNYVQGVAEDAREMASAFIKSCYNGEEFNPERVNADGLLTSRVSWSKRGDWKGELRKEAVDLLYRSGIVEDSDKNGVKGYRLLHSSGVAAMAALERTR